MNRANLPAAAELERIRPGPKDAFMTPQEMLASVAVDPPGAPPVKAVAGRSTTPDGDLVLDALEQKLTKAAGEPAGATELFMDFVEFLGKLIGPNDMLQMLRDFRRWRTER